MMSHLEYLAFFGTGRCNSDDLRNASIGRIATVIVAVAVLTFIYHRMIKRDNAKTKIVGVVLSFIVVLAVVSVFTITWFGTACSP